MVLAVKTIFLLALVACDWMTGAAEKWWETASFYQIYPRSFRDSDADGIGDLKGITQQLPYLKEIGITATWLSPIFASPMADFGYDISNFTEIDPIFGTMSDFEGLMARAKEVGVKIILDFVPNHTSDECDWFEKSVARDPHYEDFYIWHAGKVVNGVREPPTNWVNSFRGSAWSWNERRGAYYLHQFHTKQPDLNYRNVKVRETMEDVMRFWLRKGVAGFRVDAVPFLFEVAPDAAGNLPDEPRNESIADPDDFNSLLHIYTQNQPETVDLIYEFRSVMDEMNAELGGDERIMLTEAYAPLDVLMQYYGNGTMEGAQIPFNFQLISYLRNDSDAYYYMEMINSWLDNMPAGRTANWVMGNHDTSRIGSRMGEDRMDMMNMMLSMLPGCSVTYNGEEIGMTDVYISWNDTIDPQGCQAGRAGFEQASRDPERTPFQWSDANKAGFTEGTTTWLPVSDNYKLVNVKRQRGITMSHLNIYKQLHNLRAENTIRKGDAEVKALNANVLAIKRSLSGDATFVILLNIMDGVESVNLHAAFSGLPNELEYVIVTDKSPRRESDRTFTHSVLLMPKEAVVLRGNL